MTSRLRRAALFALAAALLNACAAQTIATGPAESYERKFSQSKADVEEALKGQKPLPSCLSHYCRPEKRPQML